MFSTGSMDAGCVATGLLVGDANLRRYSQKDIYRWQVVMLKLDGICVAKTEMERHAMFDQRLAKLLGPHQQIVTSGRNHQCMIRETTYLLGFMLHNCASFQKHEMGPPAFRMGLIF